MQYREELEIAAAIGAIRWGDIVHNSITTIIGAALEHVPVPAGAPKLHCGFFAMSLRASENSSLQDVLSLPGNAHLMAALTFIENTLGITAEDLADLRSVNKLTFADIKRPRIEAAIKVLTQKRIFLVKEFKEFILGFTEGNTLLPTQKTQKAAHKRQVIAEITETIRLLNRLLKYEGSKSQTLLENQSGTISLPEAHMRLRLIDSILPTIRIDLDYIKKAARNVAVQKTGGFFSDLETANRILNALPQIQAGCKLVDWEFLDSILRILPTAYDAENPDAFYHFGPGPMENEQVLEKYKPNGRSKAWFEDQIDSLRLLKALLIEKDRLMEPVCQAYTQEPAYPEGNTAVQEACNALQKFLVQTAQQVYGPKETLSNAILGRRILSSLRDYYYGPDSPPTLGEFFLFVLEMKYSSLNFGPNWYLVDGMLAACPDASDVSLRDFMWALQQTMSEIPGFLEQEDGAPGAGLTISRISIPHPRYRDRIRAKYWDYLTILRQERSGIVEAKRFQAAILLLREWHEALAPDTAWSDFWQAFLNNDPSLRNSLEHYHREHIAWTDEFRDESGLVSARPDIIEFTQEKNRDDVMAFQDQFYLYAIASARWRADNENSIFFNGPALAVPKYLSEDALYILRTIAEKAGLYEGAPSPGEDVRKFRDFMETRMHPVQAAFANYGIVVDDKRFEAIMFEAGFQFDITSIQINSPPYPIIKESKR